MSAEKIYRKAETVVDDEKKRDDAGNPGFRKLTPAEEHVIIKKGAERPFTGKYNHHYEKGTYTCRQCGAELYRSEDKFKTDCGWPGFDDEIEGAVIHKADPDGHRTEIVCAKCNGHLGHVFLGEGLTEKNTRHCVNSISLEFIPPAQKDDTKAAEKGETSSRAIFAGGCFWGVEYYMERIPGVEKAVSGYIGGNKENPTYLDIAYHATGHAEAVEVTFDPQKVGFRKLARTFFEIHDPTQKNRQGPDIGDQYRSAIFYIGEEQKETSKNLIEQLKANGYKVVTELLPAGTFYEAEKYHQDYYKTKRGTPYCHAPVNRFGD